MAPNAAPGFFLGWRIDSGIRYLGGVEIIDCDAVRKEGFDPRHFKVVHQTEVHLPLQYTLSTPWRLAFQL